MNAATWPGGIAKQAESTLPGGAVECLHAYTHMNAREGALVCIAWKYDSGFWFD